MDLRYTLATRRIKTRIETQTSVFKDGDCGRIGEGRRFGSAR